MSEQDYVIRESESLGWGQDLVTAPECRIVKEIEHSAPLLSVALPKVCELQSHNGLSVTLNTGTFQMIWFDTPQNESGNSKWFPELFLVTITADGVHHLNSLPCDTQWRFHTCWLPSTCVFPNFSLSRPLHPFCSPSG